MEEKRNLVINPTGLIVKLNEGSVSSEILADAFFYLDFPKEELPDSFSEKVIEILKKDFKKGKQVIRQFLDALVAAEKQGRAYFNDIDAGRHLTFRSLNSLLGRNGVDVSSVRRLENTAHAHYCHQTVRDEYSGILNVI